MADNVDFCTLWPDGAYGECCRLHDVAYADPFVGKLPPTFT